MGGARNGVESLDPLQVAAKIKAYVKMIEQYMFRPKQSKMREASTVASSRWTSQPAGAVCVNVDASLFPAEHHMGWGAVVRDHNGAFLLCCNEGLAALSAHKPAEVLAARQAPQLAKYHGYLKVVLTSDCLTLVQRLSSQVQDRSHVGTVISDIKALARGFETSSFKFSSRNLNVVHIV
jgi:ribonuclease HI